ncbi:MAG: amidinotransferase, partial [Bacteroidetes bacterium]|nr:amidinotransferase [Bacteroidota bacterium]
TPKLEDCYDPKSREHVLNNTYPIEEDLTQEMQEFYDVLKKYNVTIYRPEKIENYNQIFSRDIAFVIENKFVFANVVEDRVKEIQGIKHVYDQIEDQNIIHLPESCHVEGGDVMLFESYVFIGTYSADDYSKYITARTNSQAVDVIEKLFPNKTIIPFELLKSNDDARNSALHLDCCLQPVGNNKAITCPDGFLDKNQYQWIVDLFGADNIFEISREEMYNMHCNIFSIDKNVVVSDRAFTRLNTWLEENNFIVEKIKYTEVSKQGGLLRCSTLPLI